MKVLFAGLAACCLVLSACATAPIYQRAAGPDDYGYRDTALTDSQYQVRFSGGYGVARETVENLALYRAAQVALQHGSQRLKVISKDTDSVTSYGGPSTSIGYGSGFGRGWGLGYQIGRSYAYTRYQTVLQIRIGPDVPAQGDRVYDARQLKQHLTRVAESARN